MVFPHRFSITNIITFCIIMGIRVVIQFNKSDNFESFQPVCKKEDHKRGLIFFITKIHP